MKTLVIDNSNGRTKLALAEDAQLVSPVRVLPTVEICAERVRALIADWHFSRVLLCSVVPAAAKTLLSCLSECAPVVALHAEMPNLAVDFSSYKGCATLGGDRVANVVGAVSLIPGEALVVIDAGTATTVDVVVPPRDGARPRFLGGAIAPGFGTITRALHREAALLPEVPAAMPSCVIGQSTTEALQSGCVLGYRGMLRSLIAEMEAQSQRKLTVVATGGDAEFLAAMMPEIALCDPLLTLRGLAGIAS